jgi:hypothetical protein
VIIGAMRAGTTSLYEYLNAEPRIRPAERKEIHYFDLQRHRPVEWYRAHFPLALPWRKRRWLAGEATPYLLFDPTAPERVTAALPSSSRFVALLRDPVERAFSHWRGAVRLGVEPLSLAEAAAAEPGRLEAARLAAKGQDPHTLKEFRHMTYLARGEYVEQLERWIAAAGRSRLLIVQSERLFREPAAVVREVVQWLGASPRASDDATFTVFNPGHEEHMPEDTRQLLARHFAPFNERLYALLGTRYDWTAPAE